MIGLLLGAAFLFTTNTPPERVVSLCRESIPAEVELSGRIIVRNRRGVKLDEHEYRLTRRGNSTRFELDGRGVEEPSSGDLAPTGLEKSDIAWSDLTLDYLWWPGVVAEPADGETVHGQECRILRLSREGRMVRVWVDRKTGALMQAEEMKGGECVRRLWGTRLKKFGTRWMVNVLEVETSGSGHRTKITVENLKTENKQ